MFSVHTNQKHRTFCHIPAGNIEDQAKYDEVTTKVCFVIVTVVVV